MFVRRVVVASLLAAPLACTAANPPASNAPASGARPRVAEMPASQRGGCRWSTGAFLLPADAQSVDWVVLNRSSVPQAVRVTVYDWSGGETAQPVTPGTVSANVAPDASFHNANGVGQGKPFRVGMYYEVRVEAASPLVLPTVTVWSNHGGTAIAGTRIGPAEFAVLTPCPR